MSVKETFDKIGQRLAAKPEIAQNINSVYQFDLGDAGSWTLDLTKSGDYISEGAHAEPAVTVGLAADDFVKMVDGQLAPQMAFMTGKLKIKGDMGLALKLQQIIG